MDLFTSGTAQWLGVQEQGQPEQPRMLLVSVPYALKAADAETVGGLPPSAFVLAAPAASSAIGEASLSTTSVAVAAAGIGGSGITNDIPIWTGRATLGNSVMSQVGGNVSVAGGLQLPATGTANSATEGFNSQPFNLLSSVFNGTAAVNQHFLWQAEPVNPGLATASGTLNLLFAAGTGTPAETGLSINNGGVISFAAGQTFPGTGPGTVTSVGLSAPASDFTVTGSPVTNSGTLALSWNFAPTSADTPNAIVKRDSAGSFSAGAITASSAGGSATVTGTNTSNGSGVEGVTADASAFGVVGVNGSGGVGVLGSGGTGIEGSGSTGVSGTGGTYGVYGTSTSGMGVYGTTAGSSPAIWGENTATSGAISDGVHGVAHSAGASGVAGVNNSGVASSVGVYGTTSSTQGFGVEGVVGGNSAIGASSCCTGVRGDTGTPGNAGVVGTADNGLGVVAANSDLDSPALLAENTSTSGSALAFQTLGTVVGGGCKIDVSGNLSCTGTITSNGAKPFKIDHPADPAGKYLVHVAVESSEMINIYTGNIVLDASGTATVQLPSWFQIENADFRYALTAIGPPAPNLRIAEEVTNNQFKIAGGQPGQKVSWQITGLRQDAWAKANPLQAEVEKPESERDLYVHPELFGQPKEKSVYWKNAPFLTRGLGRKGENEAEPHAATPWALVPNAPGIK